MPHHIESFLNIICHYSGKRGLELKRRAKSVKASSNRKKQQGLSDGMVLLIFLVLISVIIAVFSTESQVTRQDQVKLLNQLVIEAEEEDGPAIIVGGTLDKTMLLNFANKNYDELKGLLGVTSDFVIHFEDSEGNLVDIIGKPCIGSAYARVNGYRCDG